MESLLLIVQSIGDFFQTIIDFFLNIPDYFDQLTVYINASYIYLKLKFMVYSLSVSYKTASYLLNDIGFTQIIILTFNALPDELRFYAFLFKIPQAINIIFTGFTTAFVISVSRF
ncbi:DUF2523 family protein [Vibrio anguillarum]|uniref:DUF2523 family protein n=3 Tax=Vibrio anguillarum TaxID=55601 RepID=UPI000BB4A458|nr:DUF2523 family protein [Vibrio anguillarum]ATC59454.1 DUF2523 domain-containing protein [Vibrio anguillarum]ATC59474.1 DUF2523 domain-containing protein [Vibrio anguillarum]ATC59485.1 DUF2523 domain-containing protein [Vibrio anguillarum]MBF4253244.1 DUF2523 domain-containing protein [Vibrio anguillarum]MBF4388980.1 DUF2523 domain-containing protein [Vibrio anguillarum]